MVLPIHVPAMYLCKFLILTILLSIAAALQNLVLTQIGITSLPEGTFELYTLIIFALYSLITAMPALSFMLFIASRFENMWVPLGIGVAGFLSGRALGNTKNQPVSYRPFRDDIKTRCFYVCRTGCICDGDRHH